MANITHFDLLTREIDIKGLSQVIIVMTDNNSSKIKFIYDVTDDFSDVATKINNGTYNVWVKFLSPSDYMSKTLISDITYTEGSLSFVWNIPKEALVEKGSLQFAIEILGTDFRLSTKASNIYIYETVNKDDVTMTPAEEAWMIQYDEKFLGYISQMDGKFDTAINTATEKASQASQSATDAQAAASSATAAQYALEKTAGSIQAINDVIYDTTFRDVTIELDILHGYYGKNGLFRPDVGRQSATVIVEEGEKYKLSSIVRPVTISGILFLNGDEVIGSLLDGDGTQHEITDYEFEIGSGVTSIIVQSAEPRPELSLKKVVADRTPRTYSKEESDARYARASISVANQYGIRWLVSDPDDEGERCFGVVGMEATIGIGANPGHSDFDNAYPWSQIKRCNIRNDDGVDVVTYEGEDGFALDGSNGEVFVRIPKFSVLRYVKDGYEYRVIGVAGAPIHEAFLENGKELDEIFIGAFEGFIGVDAKLHSISGVLPTSNETPRTYLDAAKENGGCYSLYDNRCVDAIWTLMAVEFGKRNSNRIIGWGASNYLQPIAQYKAVQATESGNVVVIGKLAKEVVNKVPVGSNLTICKINQNTIIAQRKILSVTSDGDYTEIAFDGSPLTISTDCFIGSAALNTNFCEDTPSGALSYHTGRADWIPGSSTQNQVRYRWIENVIGNLWHYLPDVTFKDRRMYVCRNMQDYEFHKCTGSYVAVGKKFEVNNNNGNAFDVAGANYWISDLADETFAKSVLIGRHFDKSLTSQKAFGGYYYVADGTACIANGGGFDHLWRSNVLCQRAWIREGSRWYLYGARLMYKHIE